MKKLISLALLLAVATLGAQTLDDMPLDSLITPADQAKLGLGKLTKDERESLRLYFANRLSDMYKAGFAKGQTTPAAAVNAKTPAYNGIGGRHWIKENIDRGAMILLEDGSLWEVDRIDKIDAMLWLKITNILVLESKDGAPGYDYLLVNTDDGEKVHAKYVGKR